MPLSVNSRFPVTLWPATPLPPVAVERREVNVTKRGALRWESEPLDPVELPDEWVLRQLVDADLDSDVDVTELLSEFGMIATPYAHSGWVPADRRSLLAPHPEGAPHDLAPTVDQRWWVVRRDGTLEDARWWLKTARALGRVWGDASRDEDPAPVWESEGFLLRRDADPRVHWTSFVLMLDDGLEPFSAHAQYTFDLTSLGGDAITYGRPVVDLYSAACRQVFNFIVGESTARRCENQTCGRAFVHQLGGATFGQHRSVGLRFCTPECAHAETQRQYRRRKAAQRKDQQR